MRRVTAVMLVLLLATPAGALGQGAQRGAGESSAPAEQQPPAEQSTARVDVSRLGVDVSRIRRELVEAQAESSDSPLKLSFTIQVLGTAPRIDFLAGFPVEGPVPYGPPTHDEVLGVLTPKEYRTPALPIYGLAVMAAQKLWEYNKKKQCEAEIEEYRRLVMQGVAVAAPRCSQ